MEFPKLIKYSTGLIPSSLWGQAGFKLTNRKHLGSSEANIFVLIHQYSNPYMKEAFKMKTCGFKKSSLMIGMVTLVAAAFTLPAFAAYVKEKTAGKIGDDIFDFMLEKIKVHHQ
jgi:hypothetical protein